MINLLFRTLPFLFWCLEPIIHWTELLPFGKEASLTFFLMLWMVLWWVAEVAPMGVTALIPMVFLPAFDLMSLKEVSANYANPVIYLFLGGFIIARGLEKTRLNERIALLILRFTGHSDRGIVLGFMLATSFLSMWISNTATTVMMVPIALAVLGFLQENLKAEEQSSLPQFSVVVMLALAYSANIGGIATPIGTPPNVVLMGYLEEMYSRTIDFWRWMLLALPIVLVLLALQHFLLSRLFKFSVPIGKPFRQFVRQKIKDLGPMDGSQKVTVSVFILTCGLWTFKGLIHNFTETKVLSDTGIAIFGGILLFLVPTKLSHGHPVLNGRDISHLPWNIVLLFGGGMAMASSLEKAGLIQFITEYFSSVSFSSPYMFVFVLAAASLFLTEIMSNVALCVVALPVMMKLGEVQGVDPLWVGIPVAICSSFAFSLPISTPPNAIVFGTDKVRVVDMLRAGFLLNLLGITVVMSLGWWLMGRLF